MSTWKVTDPYTKEAVGEVKLLDGKGLHKTLDAAKAAFGGWRRSPAWKRSALITSALERLTSGRARFEELIRREAGKPALFARVEVDRAIALLDWARAEPLRDAGELLRLDTAPSGRDGFGIHTRTPLGVILGITPFNFPLNLVLHKVVPAVASGNAVLIKPSPSTPLTAEAAVSLFDSEEFPGLVQLAPVNDELSAGLCAGSDVQMVSFTGSAAVGGIIRKQSWDKPVTLELGGNAWLVLDESLDGADADKALKRCAGAAFGYAGQSCISVQNVAIPKSRWKEWTELLRKKVEEIPFGDPKDPSVICGPVINEGAEKRLKAVFETAGKSAAGRQSSKRRLGDANASLVEPTAFFFDAPDESPHFSQEIFGPAMNVVPYSSREEVTDWINRGEYGLQAGVYTRDLEWIQALFSGLEVGGLIVNDVPTTRYDHQPYGGVKNSGFGREGVRYAMEEMTQSRFLALSPVIL